MTDDEIIEAALALLYKKRNHAAFDLQFYLVFEKVLDGYNKSKDEYKDIESKMLRRKLIVLDESKSSIKRLFKISDYGRDVFEAGGWLNSKKMEDEPQLIRNYLNEVTNQPQSHRAICQKLGISNIESFKHNFDSDFTLDFEDRSKAGDPEFWVRKKVESQAQINARNVHIGDNYGSYSQVDSSNQDRSRLSQKMEEKTTIVKDKKTSLLEILSWIAGIIATCIIVWDLVKDKF